MLSRTNSRFVRARTGALLIAATLLGIPQPATAQGAVVIIAGVVKGPNGAILAGAIVSAAGSDGGTRSTSTKENGKYMLFFPNGGSAFRVTVKATGYLPWTGNVQKPYNDDHIMADVTLRAGGTAADWPAPPAASLAVTFDRSQLGAADALDIVVDAADVGVIGTASEQVSHKTYRIEAPARSRLRPRADRDPGNWHAYVWPRRPFNSARRWRLRNGIGTAYPRSPQDCRDTGQGSGFVNFDGGIEDPECRRPRSRRRNQRANAGEALDGAITGSLGVIPSTMSFLGRNGNITLTLPTDARAASMTEAHQGLIYHDSTSRVVTPARFSIATPDGLESYLEAHRVDMPQPQTGATSSWIMNGGGAAITLTTLNGNIIIRKMPPKQE